jgi:hypothetical protein
MVLSSVVITGHDSHLSCNGRPSFLAPKTSSAALTAVTRNMCYCRWLLLPTRFQAQPIVAICSYSCRKRPKTNPEERAAGSAGSCRKRRHYSRQQRHNAALATPGYVLIPCDEHSNTSNVYAVAMLFPSCPGGNTNNNVHSRWLWSERRVRGQRNWKAADINVFWLWL